MGWNEKYWDIIDRYYWSPGELGFHPIAKKKWVERKGLVCVPSELVNHSAPLYTRQETPRIVRRRLEHAEEALNDLFDLTFSIASDVTISGVLFRPLDIYDGGPFTSLGRELSDRYALGDDNFMPDGFFVSERSLLGVELNLATHASADQLIKYIALMVLEERHGGPRQNYCLLFIAPRLDEAHFWSKLGLQGPKVHEGFLEGAVMSVSDPKIRKLMETDLIHFRTVAARLRMALVTWSDLHKTLSLIMRELDRSAAGEQTLYRLLAGFRDQIEIYTGAGVAKPLETA